MATNRDNYNPTQHVVDNGWITGELKYGDYQAPRGKARYPSFKVVLFGASRVDADGVSEDLGDINLYCTVRVGETLLQNGWVAEGGEGYGGYEVVRGGGTFAINKTITGQGTRYVVYMDDEELEYDTKGQKITGKSSGGPPAAGGSKGAPSAKSKVLSAEDAKEYLLVLNGNYALARRMAIANVGEDADARALVAATATFFINLSQAGFDSRWLDQKPKPRGTPAAEAADEDEAPKVPAKKAKKGPPKRKSPAAAATPTKDTSAPIETDEDDSLPF